MSLSSLRTVRDAVLLLSIAGFVAMATGAFASYLVATGSTPSWLYARYGGLSVLSPRQYWHFVPVELFGAVAFASIAVVCWWARRSSIVSWSEWAFLAACVVLALTGHVAIADRFRALPILVAGGVAIAALCLASSQPLRVFSLITSGIPAAMRTVIVHPPLRATFLAFCCISVISAQIVHARIESVSPDEARAWIFLRWYAAQRSANNEAQAHPARLRIEVFTDYQCPFSATQVPAAEASVARVHEASRLPIDFVVRDFPLEAECNDSRLGVLHPLACDAAVAVRVASAEQGPDAGHTLGMRFYQAGATLSRDMILKQLGRLKLGNEFSQQYSATVTALSTETLKARSQGVTGTPTVFVNGIKLPAGTAMLDLALQYEVAHQ